MPARGSHTVLLSAVVDRPEWQYQGKCFTEDAPTELFYPPAGAGRNGSGRTIARQMYEEARDKYCNHCDVREQCLEYAFEEGIWEGMFGGKSPRQRRAIARGERPELRVVQEGRNVNGEFVEGNKPAPKRPGSRVNQWSTVYTDEDRKEFVKQAKLHGIRGAMRLLGFPGSTSTAIRWIKSTEV